MFKSVILLLVFVMLEVVVDGRTDSSRNLVVGIPNLFAYFAEENLKNVSLCEKHIQEYLFDLQKRELWALQMLDASSKIPSGILTGNFRDVGNFVECLQVNHNSAFGKIIGKHCMGSVNISTSLLTPEESQASTPNSYVALSWSICVPDSCSAFDLSKLLSFVENFTNMDIPLVFSDESCQSKSSQPSVDGGDITVILFFCLIISITICSTVYDITLYYLNLRPKYSLLVAFSAFTNGRKLISTNSSSSQLKCLNGIRSISMMWVILGHVYVFTGMLLPDNFIEALRFITSSDSMFILTATLSVDTFFLIGGAVLVYVFLNTMDKGEKFNLALFYFHRYLRLTPPLLAIILVHLTILKHFGSGPGWPTTYAVNIKPCEDYWWSTLLYVQNYVNVDDMCLGQSWYLAVDTQLFILSPLVLIPLTKWPKKTLLGIFAIILAVEVGVFVTAWDLSLIGLAGLGPKPDDIEKYNDHYYMTTHTRATPWLIGLVLGYFIYDFKKHDKTLKLPKKILLIIWTTTFALLGVCVFCGHNLITDQYQRWANAIYLTFLRPTWTIALCWIIFSCLFGCGGPINWFLSLPIFQVLSRLTYSMYIVHMTIIITVLSSQKIPERFSHFNMLIFDFWGYFILTMSMAIGWTLLFESPILALEKILFGRGVETQKPPERIEEVRDSD